MNSNGIAIGIAATLSIVHRVLRFTSNFKFNKKKKSKEAINKKNPSRNLFKSFHQFAAAAAAGCCCC